ncbi:hypothetical protein IC582_030149 [Cucumis melo]
MLNWVVDSHPEWKDLAKKVFDNDQFKFEAMFEEDFVERRTFHEYVMREETNVTFERGESSRQGLSTSSQKKHEERDFTFTVLRSPYTTKSDSTKPKKERIEFNAQGFEAPTFKLLSQDL